MTRFYLLSIHDPSIPAPFQRGRLKRSVSKNVGEYRENGDNTIDAGIVRLDKGLDYFPVLDEQGVSLAPVVSEDLGRAEEQVHLPVELARSVCEEANTALLLRVKRFTPRLGSMEVSGQQTNALNRQDS